MTSIRDMMQLCSNLKELGRCGLTVKFTGPQIEKVVIGSDVDTMELAGFTKFWRLVFHSIRSWMMAALMYSDGAPYFLAGLLHEQRSVVEDTFQFFKKYLAAYEWAKTKTSETLQTVTDRCPLQCTSMMYAAKFAQSGGFEAGLLLCSSDIR
jgi:hypothetical protein